MRFAEGLERTVALVPATTTDWWEPIRCGDYRAYYERQYGRSLGLAPAAGACRRARVARPLIFQRPPC